MHLTSEDLNQKSPEVRSGLSSSANFGETSAARMRRKRSQLAQVPPTNFAIANPNQLPQLDAVIIRNLTYEVGRGRKKKAILNGINLTVPEGSIYGLLGPSGCGKTTMLRCIVGRIWPRSGSVMVFGLRPGEGLGEVPGRDVGYMPQEISIYEDFTIEETLRYFGKINRMPTSDIKKRIEFLLQFLDLPSKRRTVANLSGGQKRRVSLAAALVHSPPLLILDEPTVGVDPLLRQSIWQHLVAMTKTERISVIITTHYIEEARLANVVGLMRNGRILAEDSPDELMHANGLRNLEDVFLKLCVTDSSRRAAQLAIGGGSGSAHQQVERLGGRGEPAGRARRRSQRASQSAESRRHRSTVDIGDRSAGVVSTIAVDRLDADRSDSLTRVLALNGDKRPTVLIHTGTNKIQVNAPTSGSHVNEAIEVFSSEEDDEKTDEFVMNTDPDLAQQKIRYHLNLPPAPTVAPTKRHADQHPGPVMSSVTSSDDDDDDKDDSIDSYLALQHMHWAARRANIMNLLKLNSGRQSSGVKASATRLSSASRSTRNDNSSLVQWWQTLMAVTWKNYVRLRRNPPVLVFQFMLPAIQVILFCLCIGGEPFDVPVAIVNDEVVPKSSLQFLDGLNKKIIRQIKYDNLTSALEAVKRGKVWGAIHIPDKYSENLQSRLIMVEEATNETISNGTIRVYPDLTNLHLAMTLENTFRDTFIKFARNSLEELGYDRSLADLPIQMGKPIYGTLRKDGYLEFMAPGVVISISYVMATGLTALAFILERRDGLLERSLVSGVQTSQILLAHAINQVFVMMFQIMLVLGCTFFIFEIPSRGPFFWVILLILLQGCTGMSFGLLVSAVCAEENTAVMMVVGTFYTNLILAGIIWPIEAMPHWLRPVSYAQPQTLPTDTLRHILSRGWGITEPGVLLGFAVTIGWLVVFLIAAGVIFKYSR